MDLLKERKLKKRIGRKTKMIYYISDTHFRDQAIFDKCKRPFKSLDEMESTVISNGIIKLMMKMLFMCLAM